MSNQQGPGVCYAFVEVSALLLIEEGYLGFLKTVECIGCGGVGGLVWMDQEGLFAVLDFDVGIRNAGLEI